jgi:hypothetical protein
VAAVAGLCVGAAGALGGAGGVLDPTESAAGDAIGEIWLMALSG